MFSCQKRCLIVKLATENVKETEASVEYVELMAALERALRRQAKGVDEGCRS